MPNDTDSVVSGLTCFHWFGHVARASLTNHHRSAVSGRSSNRLLNRDSYRVELVVASHLLGELPVSSILVDHEVPNQIKAALLRKDTLEHHLKLGITVVYDLVTLDGAPWHEALSVGSQAANSCLDAIGDHKELIELEQLRNPRLVGLKLVERLPYIRVFVGGVLKLNDPDGKAVDEEENIGAALILTYDRELVDGQEVVVVWLVEVDDSRLSSPDGAIFRLVFNCHAIHQHPMECSVAHLKRGAYWVADFALHLKNLILTELRIQTLDRGVKTGIQDHGAVVTTF